eukprot:gb/GECG01008624.1/.p1 GENE.gb/GECG01008624.1/~~gb/GECG01008624.1/.p1  ORF type:complete len:1092 (+),score=102.08 gb/GECG01008624.1/:1-3276(+)
MSYWWKIPLVVAVVLLADDAHATSHRALQSQYDAYLKGSREHGATEAQEDAGGSRARLIEQYHAQLKAADVLHGKRHLPIRAKEQGTRLSSTASVAGIPSVCASFPSALNVLDSNISTMKSSWGMVPNSAGSAQRCKSANGSEFCILHASFKLFGICVPSQCANGNRTVIQSTFAYSFPVWWYAAIDPKWKVTCGWHSQPLSDEGAAFLGVMVSVMILCFLGIITARCRCTREYSSAYASWRRRKLERERRLNTVDSEGERVIKKPPKPQFIWEQPHEPFDSFQSREKHDALASPAFGRPKSKESSGHGASPQLHESFHIVDPMSSSQFNRNLSTESESRYRRWNEKGLYRLCGWCKKENAVSRPKGEDSFRALLSNETEESLLRHSTSINTAGDVDQRPRQRFGQRLLCCWGEKTRSARLSSDASDPPSAMNFKHSPWGTLPYYIVNIFESEDAEKAIPRLIPQLDGVRVLGFLHVMLGSTAYYMRTLGIEAEASVLGSDGVLSSTSFQFVLASDFSNDTLLLLAGFLAFHALIRRVDHQLNSEGTIQVTSTLPKLKESVKAVAKGVAMKLTRVAPLYYTIVGFYALLGNSLGKGPFWTLMVPGTDACKQHWWTNFLFVNNFVPGPSDVGSSDTDSVWSSRCLPFTSYIAIDMQLFMVVTPIVILLYVWKRLAAFIFLLVLMAISIILSGLIVNKHSLSSLVHFETEHYHVQSFSVWNEEYMWKFYLQPHTRALPWLLGMFTAMSFHLHATVKGVQLRAGKRQYRPRKIFNWGQGASNWQALLKGGASQASTVKPFMTRLFGSNKKHRLEALDIWDASIILVAGALMGAVSFGSVNLYTKGSSNQIFWYTSFSRVAWSMGMGAMLAACIWENRGLVARVLAHNAFRQVSRRIYAALLLQQILLQALLYSRASLIYYSNSELIIWWAGSVFLSLCFSEFMHRLLARPAIKAMTLILDRTHSHENTTQTMGKPKYTANNSPGRRIMWEDSKDVEPHVGRENPEITTSAPEATADNSCTDPPAGQRNTSRTSSDGMKWVGSAAAKAQTNGEVHVPEDTDRFRLPAQRFPAARRLPIREAHRSRNQKKFGRFSP